MRARIWGSRGSLATPGPDTVRYGGNTACIEVALSDGSLVILDAGTGIRGLGVSLDGRRPTRIDILLTHLHLDHLEGLGFFTPLWDPGTDLHIWGPTSPVQSLSERIATVLSPPLFPVHLTDVPSSVTFHDAPQGEWAIGSATITSQPIIHAGPTVGYRIEEQGRTLAYLTDHEPALGACALALDGVLGFLDIGQDAAGALEIARAGVGQRHLPRGPLQKPRAKTVLQRGNQPRDARGRQAKLAGRGGKALQVGHGDKGVHGIDPVHRTIAYLAIV